MKRFAYLLIVAMLALNMQAQQAKYVFYFIGDGMGVNQVNGTEMYIAANQGRIGYEPLLFASFPVATVAATYSTSNPITDSAAAGTALATGVKTYNGAIGLNDNKERIETIAEMAKAAAYVEDTAPIAPGQEPRSAASSAQAVRSAGNPNVIRKKKKKK